MRMGDILERVSCFRVPICQARGIFEMSASRFSTSRLPILEQARDRLQRAIARHRQLTTDTTAPTHATLNQALAHEGQALSELLEKLEQGLVRIAVFGLVSRGKSALLNAIIGHKQLETGPINGVTRTPTTVQWDPQTDGTFCVELIDTPGLDEIGGQARGEMAQSVAEQADLILFVLAGDITRKELQAIRRLWRFQKPLLIVFNKIDLYPAPDRRAIVKNLRQYLAEDGTDSTHSLQIRNILQVAADPAPLKMKTEWPDGRMTEAWETPPAEISELTDRLRELLSEEGPALLALNALVQTRSLEQVMARKTLHIRQTEAEALIWKFVRAKGIAIAANPIAVLDLIGGAITDLALIRALANLYGLPMTSHEAGQLWQKILWSSGGLLVSELGSGLVLGMGKGMAALGSLDNPAGLAAYGGAAIAQGSIAGYGSYIVGRAAQTYLEQGCTWGETGASTLIRGILAQVDKPSILYRLRSELEQTIGLP